MDEEFYFQAAPPPDPIATATECLIALSAAVDEVQSYPARRHLLQMMESIVFYTRPNLGQLVSFPGGRSGTDIN